MSKQSDDGALPALRAELLFPPNSGRLEPPIRASHPPRILLLYGSLRERSYSRLLVEEANRLLRAMGAETRIFDPRDLPVVDSVPKDHPKVQELRALSLWSEGPVWCSPERHGAITGIFKNQIDWLPLEEGSVRPTQGRTLAVMQVSGGSQSFNAVNTLRLLGRWMRMFTIPNQSSVPKAYEQFDEAGRMLSANDVVVLYRPVGPEELTLIRESGFRAFPPRLAEQPIFYPVLTEAYAVKIARDWNVPASGSGYVTRFAVLASHLVSNSVHDAGGITLQKYWIPAEELPAFNAAIAGQIEVIAEFHRTEPV